MERQTQGKVQFPPFAQRIFERGELEGERSALRRVLALRKLTDGERWIDECTDLDTLRRWHDQAVLAASAAEALA